ncbi:hypothetical protein P0Y35_12825 [Kiritimatiellaeota bacterium B1221]|nr:hypothetical protein [Kiritimatiellaeota bacterium B1221]
MKFRFRESGFGLLEDLPYKFRMPTEVKTEKRKPLHFGWMLLISFVLFNSAPIVDQTLRWSNHFNGFVNGVFHIFFYGWAWVLYFLPWSLVIYGVYRWRKWKRYRAVWTLVPTVLIWGVVFVGFVTDPPTAKGIFERKILNPMPASVKNLRAFRAGGGVADYTYLISFDVDPEEFEAVLKSRPFERSSRKLRDLTLFRKSYGEDPQPAIYEFLVGEKEDWPSPYEWGEVEVYEFETENHHWWYTLITDKAHRRVFFEAGCY